MFDGLLVLASVLKNQRYIRDDRPHHWVKLLSPLRFPDGFSHAPFDQ